MNSENIRSNLNNKMLPIKKASHRNNDSLLMDSEIQFIQELLVELYMY